MPDAKLISLVGRDWFDPLTREFIDQISPITRLELQTAGRGYAKPHGVRLTVGRDGPRRYLKMIRVHLLPDHEDDEMGIYTGPLPFGLEPNDWRVDVRHRLGPPARSDTPYFYKVRPRHGAMPQGKKSNEAGDEYDSEDLPTDPEVYSPYLLRVDYSVKYNRLWYDRDEKGHRRGRYKTGPMTTLSLYAFRSE